MRALRRRYGRHGSLKSHERRMLDVILDSVKPREKEVTFDTEGYTNAQVQEIIATAKARGLSAAFDGRFVLVRDLRAARVA